MPVLAAIKAIASKIALILPRVAAVNAGIFSQGKCRSKYCKAQQSQNSSSHIASLVFGALASEDSRTLCGGESCNRGTRIFTTFYAALTTLYATSANFPYFATHQWGYSKQQINLPRSAV